MTTMFLALVLGQAFPSLDAPKPAAPASQSLAHVKQIGLATLMYLQDNGDVLPKAGEFRKAVSRYLKDADAFTAPGAPKGTTGYFLDPRLSGKRVTNLYDLAGTAMILQGTNGKPTFPYDGRTVVGFVDGHAKLVPMKAALKARMTPLK